jgi:hypothetical protein
MIISLDFFLCYTGKVKYFLKYKKIAIFLILILVGGFFVFSDALGVGFLKNFGGRITTVIPCTCSTGSQVTIIGSPKIFSGTYFYSPSTTRVKGKGNILPSRKIIGKYMSYGGLCLVGVAPECTQLPISKGIMELISTN